MSRSSDEAFYRREERQVFRSRRRELEAMDGFAGVDFATVDADKKKREEEAKQQIEKDRKEIFG